jgi:hypothetical protein
LSVTPVADAVLIAVNRIDVLAMNRLIGLGLREPPGDATLEQVMDAFVRAGAPRFFVPVAPVDGHEAIAVRLERFGLRHYNNWVRLSRDLDDVEELHGTSSAAIEVRQIGHEGAEPFGRIVAEAFGYPPPIARLSAQTIGRLHWQHYLAYAESTPIAAAAMYVAGEAAWFGFAATDAAQRRRGGQQALVIRRLKDAAAAGCRWVSVETAEDTVTRDAPSFRNLRRLGFDVAYRRPNYLWVRRT